MTLDLTPGAPEWCARVTASKVAGMAIEAQGITVSSPFGIQPGGERFRQQSCF